MSYDNKILQVFVCVFWMMGEKITSADPYYVLEIAARILDFQNKVYRLINISKD